MPVQPESSARAACARKRKLPIGIQSFREVREVVLIFHGWELVHCEAVEAGEADGDGEGEAL